MRFVKSSNGGNKYNNALNITLRITGFVEEGDQEGAQGINVLTGQQITVWLTTTGKAAENKDRPSIRYTREVGHKIGRDLYKLVKGGLVSFKSAFPKKPNSDQFFATWMNVLGYNESDAKNYSLYAKCATLTIEKKENGYWGQLVRYSTGLDTYLVAPVVDIDELYPGIKTHAESWLYPYFLIRFLDTNNKVLGYVSYRRTWLYTNVEKTEGRNLTPSELAQACLDYIKTEIENYSSIVNINIVLGKGHTVSIKQLKSEMGLKRWKTVEKNFYSLTESGGTSVREYYCKEIFARLGGVRNEFVNWMQPVTPNANEKCIDPVLIGGLEYSATLDADKTKETESEQQSHSIPESKRIPVDSPGAPEESHTPSEPSAPSSGDQTLSEDPWIGLDNIPPIPEESFAAFNDGLGETGMEKGKF